MRPLIKLIAICTLTLPLLAQEEGVYLYTHNRDTVHFVLLESHFLAVGKIGMSKIDDEGMYTKKNDTIFLQSIHNESTAFFYKINDSNTFDLIIYGPNNEDISWLFEYHIDSIVLKNNKKEGLECNYYLRLKNDLLEDIVWPIQNINGTFILVLSKEYFYPEKDKVGPFVIYGENKLIDGNLIYKKVFSR